MKTNMAASVLTVGAPGLSPAPLTVLLVGNQKEDFFLIREILSRSKDSFSAELDHATSLDEVKTMLQRKACGLVLFEYATKDAAAVELLSQFLNGGSSVPFILLAENANERTVCRDHRIRHMELHGEVGIEWVNLVRTVRCARALHATQQGQSIDTRYIAQAFSRRTRLPALPRRPIRANLVAAGEQVSTGGSMERAPLPPTLTTSTNPDEGTSHAERSFPAKK